MGAMRFGLMPSVKKNYNGASSHTAMVEQASTKNIGSRDPAGFTAVDVLAAGSFATIISAGDWFHHSPRHITVANIVTLPTTKYVQTPPAP